MENSVEMGGREFKLNKMDLFKQLHVARRMAPILVDMLPSVKKFSGLKKQEDAENMSVDERLDMMAGMLTPFVNGYAKLSDEDSEYVLLALLSSVEVKQAQFGNYAKIAVGKIIQIEGMEIGLLIQLAGKAFMYNLSGFFPGLL